MFWLRNGGCCQKHKTSSLAVMRIGLTADQYPLHEHSREKERGKHVPSRETLLSPTDVLRMRRCGNNPGRLFGAFSGPSVTYLFIPDYNTHTKNIFKWRRCFNKESTDARVAFACRRFF